MTAPQPSFFVVGGTLHRDAPSYVARQADLELYQALRQGRFCYILTSRQMGKSSLMVRTVVRLRGEGDCVAVLDMTAIGQNLTPEQWYDGLLNRIGLQLDLEDELEDFWLEHARLAPLQRWARAIHEVVLARKSGRVTIFIDEIDAVRSLPFSTDEFFAAIREFYNRRTEDPELGRLTFCLLGVASPSDLIRDTRTTPFNIGQRIELRDFTAEEAAPLRAGLDGNDRDGQKLLRRVLYWTDGHPYLTQRLCRAVAEDGRVKDPAGVDELCTTLFLSPRARERDDNLLFVRERLLSSELELAGLLDLYGRIRRGKRMADDELNPRVTALRLAGIVGARDGRLRVRNPIYARAFDLTWVRENMPDAELERQRAAFRRGLWRAAGLSAVIIAVMAGLALAALRQRDRAEEQSHRAEALAAKASEEATRAAEARRTAETAEGQARDQAARANTEAQRAEAARQAALAAEKSARDEAARANLESARAAASKRQAQESERTASGQAERARDLLRMMAYGELRDADPTLAALFLGEINNITGVPQWREAALEILRRPLSSAIFGMPRDRVLEARFIPGSDRVVVLSQGSLRTFASDGKAVSVMQIGSRGTTPSMEPSPDGRWLAVSVDDSLRVLPVDRLAGAGSGAGARVPAGPRVGSVEDSGSPARRLDGGVRWMTFSRDGSSLLTASSAGTIQVWPLESGSPGVVLALQSIKVTAAHFSPDGRRVVVAAQDGTVRVYPVEGGPPVVLAERNARATAARFSPDGSKVAAGFADGSVDVLPASGGREAVHLAGHTTRVSSLEFSPDGSRLLTGSADGTARLWRTDGRGAPQVFSGHTAAVSNARFNIDGSRVLTASLDGTARLWPADGSSAPVVLKGHGEGIVAAELSANGSVILTVSHDGTARLWPLPMARSGPASAVQSAVSGPSGEALQQRLRSSTSACIPPPPRVRFLAETAEESRAAYNDCERRHSRPSEVSGGLEPPP